MSYGMQLMFSILQLLLSLYLIISGLLSIFSPSQDSKWFQRPGLNTDYLFGNKLMFGWLKIVLGVAMLLPIYFAAPFWVTSIACLAAFFLILYRRGQKAVTDKRTGRVARSVMASAAVIVFCLTVYEGKDMIVTTKVTFTKAMLYRTAEKSWQQMHDPNTPQVGELATDFELFDPNGEKRFRLSDYKGKRPAILLFGSYT